MNSFYMGHYANSYPIHYWIGCEPILSGVHTLSNGGWDVDQYGVARRGEFAKHFFMQTNRGCLSDPFLLYKCSFGLPDLLHSDNSLHIETNLCQCSTLLSFFSVAFYLLAGSFFLSSRKV